MFGLTKPISSLLPESENIPSNSSVCQRRSWISYLIQSMIIFVFDVAKRMYKNIDISRKLAPTRKKLDGCVDKKLGFPKIFTELNGLIHSKVIGRQLQKLLKFVYLRL